MRVFSRRRMARAWRSSSARCAFWPAATRCRLRRACGGYDPGAHLRKPFRGNLANPRGAAGNDHRLALHRNSPYRLRRQSPTPGPPVSTITFERSASHSLAAGRRKREVIRIVRSPTALSRSSDLLSVRARAFARCHWAGVWEPEYRGHYRTDPGGGWSPMAMERPLRLRRLPGEFVVERVHS